MKGILGFENHRIRCVIGIGEQERSREQDIFVDLKVKRDFSVCSTSDNLADTIDYVSLADLCTRLAKKNGYQLLEALAADILNQTLKEFSVEEAWIKIKKPAGIETADFSLVELNLRQP